MKKWFAVLSVCLLFAACACSFTPQEEDFSLALVIEKQELAQGEDLSFTITFQNNSGRMLYVFHGCGEGIESMLIWGLRGADGESYGPAFTNVGIHEFMRRGTFERDVVWSTAEMPAGEYFLTAYADFLYKEQDFEFSTEEFTVTVV